MKSYQTKGVIISMGNPGHQNHMKYKDYREEK